MYYDSRRTGNGFLDRGSTPLYSTKLTRLKKQMLKMAGWAFLYGIVSYLFVSKTYAMELVGVFMVYPVLKLYNGERGKAKWMKWFFMLIIRHI